jgi:nicotinamide-nucleotide amidase
MRAEIISIGTEITTGQNLDTNSQWLSQQLAALGIPVAFHTTIADNLPDNIEAIGIAVRRCNLVIITGGLGPTLDDLTREALAAVANQPLEFHAESLAAIEAMFRSRNRPMPDRNRVQAMFPHGSEPIPNQVGTAPGIWMTIGGCHVAALPGVPREMHPMFEDWVRPRLSALGIGGEVLIERRINTFGAGESQVEALLGDMTARGRVPEVGITASAGTIRLRIVAKAADALAAQRLIAPTEQAIRDRLGDLIYGVDDEELHDVAARLLMQSQKTIATAESITAGQIAERLARVPGISAHLNGGAVTYTNDIKTKVLGVPKELIDRHGAVSAAVAEAMARGARSLFDSDLAISATGLAGPSTAGEDHPVGTVYLGLAWADGVLSRHVQWFGSRVEIQGRAARSALNLVRLFLEGKVK